MKEPTLKKRATYWTRDNGDDTATVFYGLRGDPEDSDCVCLVYGGQLITADDIALAVAQTFGRQS